MHFTGLVGWSSWWSWGRGEHQSAASRGQTHCRSMWRPQGEGWHPALYWRDRKPHRQTCGATQTVCLPSSHTRMSGSALWILDVILRRSFCRLKLQPRANSWHVLPAWKICCCLSTLGMRPPIRFLTVCTVCGVMGSWYICGWPARKWGSKQGKYHSGQGSCHLNEINNKTHLKFMINTFQRQSRSEFAEFRMFVLLNEAVIQ